jgi:hypothetical protein
MSMSISRLSDFADDFIKAGVRARVMQSISAFIHFDTSCFISIFYAYSKPHTKCK